MNGAAPALRNKRRGKIRGELVLGLLSVALISGLTTYAAVLLSFRRDFDALVERNDIETAAALAVSLADQYRAAGSWLNVNQKIEALLIDLPPSQAAVETAGPAGRKPSRYDEMPLVVTDDRGDPVYYGIRVKGGDRGLKQERRFRTEDGEAVVVDGRTVGYVYFKSMIYRSYNSQEAAFIDALTGSIGVSVSVGLILSLALGLILAAGIARPIAALDSAVRRIAAGDLGAHVPVSGRNELGSLAENFNRMSDRLHATEAARQRLLSDIAHELRTPVSVIQANLEMMIDGVYDLGRDRLGSLYEETRILSSLIGDLRSLSDLDAGTESIRLEAVRLSSLVAESCGDHRPLFDSRGIKLSVDVEDGMTVAGDSEKLRQVMRNILDNALKYAPAGSSVSVSSDTIPQAWGDDRFVRVTVSDEGPGVPEGDTEKIFDRLYRVDSSRSRTSGGRGLGLAICKKTTESFGGLVGAYNRKPRGLSVWFQLPVAGCEG